MKLENQVCSLEYAKKLKELGVKQDSLFYWEQCIAGIHKDKTQDGGFALVSKKERQLIDMANTSAFTVAELGELLPMNYIKTPKGEMYFKCDYQDSLYWYMYCKKELSPISFSAKTEADARAKCLCFLIENNLINL